MMEIPSPARYRPPAYDPANASSSVALQDTSTASAMAAMAAAEEAALRPSYNGLNFLEMPDAKYWSGADQPWRNGTNDSPIIDEAIIAREELRRGEAEQEDAAAAPTPAATADRLHQFGIQIGFLLFMTFKLDLWKWKTWEVVQFLVKPATEHHNRCRFAELPLVRRFTGPATVFASHCWGAKWGDLVAAVCAGADKARRVVWIDVFAVRQWPGNGADLDFRGVIQRTAATIVAVAPVEGRLAEDGHMVS